MGRAFCSLNFQNEPLVQPNQRHCSLTKDVCICCRFGTSIYRLSRGGTHAPSSTAVGLALLLHASHSGSRQSGEITEICSNVKQNTKRSIFSLEFSCFFFSTGLVITVPVHNKCNCVQIHDILQLQEHLLCKNVVVVKAQNISLV